MIKLLSLDSETSGIDLRHGARPFFVTTCDDQGYQRFWEWSVDPLTRKVEILEEDLRAIAELIDSAETLVLQNCKFDCRALEVAGLDMRCWDWSKVQDTLISGHLLASNQPHDLTSMAYTYLGVSIQLHEDILQEAVMECRRKVQQAKLRDKKGQDAGPLACWEIARKDLEDMPSAKDKTWKYDTWLPRCMAAYEKLPEPGSMCKHRWPVKGWVCPSCLGHRWWVVLRDYANADSETTIALWLTHKQRLISAGLLPIYEESRKLPEVIYAMESRGMSNSGVRTDHLQSQYEKESELLKSTCIGLAQGKIEKLPVNGASNALREVLFGQFGLESSRFTKKGNASLDKYVLEDWAEKLPPDTPASKFIRNLQAYRKRQTALSFISSYKKYRRPWRLDGQGIKPFTTLHPVFSTEWFVLYPSFNQTGTDTLRFSCSNPNGQQLSKQEIAELLANMQGVFSSGKGGYSARYMFGPLPGREWWSIDYENIELRIPAYESGEQAMIDLFERPDDPPYYGSYHLLNAHLIYPDLWETLVCPKCLGVGKGCLTLVGAKEVKICLPEVPLCSIKGGFKKKFSSTWYQWIKNANFALIYGCQEAKFDITAHRPGGYQTLRRKLPKLFEHGDRVKAFADKHGYVETVPDRTVDPTRGYPIWCTRTEFGKVLPTVPLNYRTQSTAMWCTRKAMPRCHAYLGRIAKDDTRGYYIILQAHDEMVFDFPYSPNFGNLPKVRKLQKLMEESGDDIGIPLKASIKYHPNNWGEEVSV